MYQQAATDFFFVVPLSHHMSPRVAFVRKLDPGKRHGNLVLHGWLFCCCIPVLPTVQLGLRVRRTCEVLNLAFKILTEYKSGPKLEGTTVPGTKQQY